MNIDAFVSDLDAMFHAAPGPFHVPTVAALRALAEKHEDAALTAERDRYKAALEKIAVMRCTLDPSCDCNGCLAAAALRDPTDTREQKP